MTPAQRPGLEEQGLIPDMIPIQHDLLPTEDVIIAKPANYIIRLKDYRLSTIWLRALMPLIGVGGKEAIGGTLYLTNYRLIFDAHALNRVKGTFSIFLPTIRQHQNASGLIIRKIRVATGRQSFEFVVWGVPALLVAIRQAQSVLDDSQQQNLRQLVVANLDILCTKSRNAPGGRSADPRCESRLEWIENSKLL